MAKTKAGAIELNTATDTQCYRCGKKFSGVKRNLPTSYASLYKGVGRLPYCKDCVMEIFMGYLAVCKDNRLATKQVCRKLDLFWSDSLYDSVEGVSTVEELIFKYLNKLNQATYAGKSYDDTMLIDGTMWGAAAAQSSAVSEVDPDDIDQSVIDEWGPGYTPDMYAMLERRREYWIKELPDGVVLDVGTKALIRQICSLELDINRDRAEGKQVDKPVNTLNSLLNNTLLKPAQKKEERNSDLESTPLGVWLDRYEFKRPLPEVDEDLKDVDGIVKYILAWVYGHLAKMFKVKNANLKLYEEEVEKYRVERPEFDEEDDDDAMFDILSGTGGEAQ